MTTYYNEHDPKAAAWLRELIKGGHIAPGEVDERSIEDIRPGELAGYTQCHFFAGIGGWSYALRLAGWPDDVCVWTGSCPCQPFSAAGKGAGFADERHLWPAWFHLIRECRPSRVFGEQVANALPWFDLVQGDLENEDYAVGGAIIGAHSVGAPHIRQRLYWVADLLEHASSNGWVERRPEPGERSTESRRAFGELADTARQQQHGRRDQGRGRREPSDGSELGNTNAERQQQQPECDGESLGGSSTPCGIDTGRSILVGHAGGERLEGWGVSGSERRSERTPWAPSDLIWCRDGKWRPVEPGSFPLAHGVPGRVGLLRGYGNAIVPQDAATFIEAYRGLA